MFGNPFYHSTLRKIVSSFGSIFANIMVIKKLGDNEVERLHVPLSYGPASRFLSRINEDPDLDRRYSIKLPRMAFEISSIDYDSSRKLNTIKRQISTKGDSSGVVNHQYNGVPYTVKMDLTIISKYIDEANQIFEQIVPWFTPAFTITINSIPELNHKDDVPITLTSVSLDDNYTEDWVSRREVTWSLSFDMKVMFYGPVVDRSIITKTILDTYASSVSADLDDPMQRQLIPRVIRNTSVPDPTTAQFDEEFGYTTTTELFNDNKVRYPETGLDVLVTHRISVNTIESLEEVYKPVIK